MNEQDSPLPAAKRRYVWPWFVAALVLLGIVLAVVWMSREVRRVQEQRQFDAPPAH